VTAYDAALLLHLLAVIAFFAGAALATAAQLAAARRPRPGEVAAVLALARTGVVLVGAGALLVLVSGLWLIEETGHSLGDGWVALALGLLVAAGVLGAAGGRKPKRARLLAERQPADAPLDPQIPALLRDRVSLALNAASGAAALAILVLMVWRPA
jgi:uncharacterized membrane protein